MASNPVAAVGDKARNGSTVVRVNASQQNDTSHVGLNPDAGRLELMAPDGSRYTTVASHTVQVHASGVNGWAGASDPPLSILHDAQ